MCVIKDFVAKYCEFHSYMIYNKEKRFFDMKKIYSKNPGIYIILQQVEEKKFLLHKVGKADGIHGLHGRLKAYYGNHGVNDKTSIFIDKIMNTELSDTVLLMYILEVPTYNMSVFDNNVIMSPARSLENQISRKAEKEGHPLLLSKFH